MDVLEAVAKVGLPSLTAVAGVYRLFLHRRVQRALEVRRLRFKHINEIPQILNTLEEIGKDLKEVRTELRTNGGRSLRDELTAVAGRTATNEHRLRTLMQSHQMESVFETNAAGEWVWTNRQLIGLTGRTSEELLGNGWKNIIVRDDRAQVAEEWKYSVRDHRECIVRFRLVHREGHTVAVTMNSYPVRAQDGLSIIGYFGIIELTEAPLRRATDPRPDAIG